MKIENSKGFTLIELAVVVAIVGIVSAISIGGYLSWKPGHVFRAAVSQVQNDLMRTKMRAIETRRECRVVFTTNGYEIQDGDQVMNSGAWGRIDSSGAHTSGVPYASQDFSGLPQVSISSPSTFRFSPRGRLVPPSGSINVVHDVTGSAQITLNIVGRIDITWP